MLEKNRHVLVEDIHNSVVLRRRAYATNHTTIYNTLFGIYK